MFVQGHKSDFGFMYSVCILIFVSAISTFSKADVPCPDPICKCENRTATCKGNISYIPPLPSKTTVLIFENNYLPLINRNTFSNITNLKLVKLQFSMYKIQNITSDALYNFNSTLKILNLTGNTRISKQQLSSSLRQVNGIKHLYLNQINMEDNIYPHFFKGMEKSQLKQIELRDNNFHHISDKVLQGFTYLKQLDLSNNSIVFIELFGLVHVTTLKLSNNVLSKVPEFCLNGTSKFPKMKELCLDNTVIDVLFKASWSCLTSLKSLHLEWNKIKSLDDNVFSQLKRLNRLVSDYSKKVQTISLFAFNNSNLKLLYLKHCDIRFTSDNFDYANLLRWCPNLHDLHLDYNNMLFMNATSLMSMLSPLNKLTKLNLESNKLISLPAEFFNALVSLTNLYLSSNLIYEWPLTLFSNVSKLQKLLMANNRIKVIKEGYLPSSLIESLTTLDLSGNPFDCICENLWFRKWMDNILRQKPNIFYKYPKLYQCATPSRLQGTLLMNYNPTDEDCSPWGHVLMLIIITSSAVLLVFACVAVVYIQRWNIRYLLHKISMRRKEYTLVAGTDLQYDLYVAYSDKDASWVRNELWREHGQERGLNLYIRDKSEDPGVAKCDSIINNMYDSRKVLLVISSNFMSCPWCLYQLQIARGRAVHKDPGWMILVILGELQIRHVTKSLHVLLKQENAITWSEEVTGKSLKSSDQLKHL